MKGAFIAWVLLAAFSSVGVASVPGSNFLQYLEEKKHFLLSASRHFEDQMWVDYNGLLYFRPNTSEALGVVKSIREARERYMALTNVTERDEIRLKVLQDSGISPRYLKHLTTPNDLTNAVPVLHEKQLKLLRGYTWLRSFAGGDALIQTEAPDRETLYIYQFDKAAVDVPEGEMLSVSEGLTTYQTAAGSRETVMAYRCADLTGEDRETLRKIRDACAKHASQLESAIEALKKPATAPKPPANLRIVK